MIPAIAIGLVIGSLCATKPVNRPPKLKYGQRMSGPYRPSPTPYPWMSNHVNVAIRAGIARGIRDPEQLALYACQHSYPVTPRGSPATWNPFAKQGPHERGCYLRCLARARAIIAIETDYYVNGPDEDQV